MSPVQNRKIKIKFSADTAASMQWNFKPQQIEITVVPGETALAFYTATNPTDKQVIGISTYNVLPFEVGQYFNKIQCFCFEEQMLNPHEQVSLLTSHMEHNVTVYFFVHLAREVLALLLNINFLSNSKNSEHLHKCIIYIIINQAMYCKLFLCFKVDMPVFFYIDPEFAEDPKMEFVNEIVLSYTFFEAKPGFKLPIPSYARSHSVK